MTIEIYQLPHNHPSLFGQNVGLLPEHELVYTFGIKNTCNNISELLEEVYMMFNGEHPADFKGHSLSMSDIVKIDGTSYQCEFIGFKKLQ